MCLERKTVVEYAFVGSKVEITYRWEFVDTREEETNDA